MRTDGSTRPSNVITFVFLAQYVVLMIITLWAFQRPFAEDMWIYYDAGQRVRMHASPYLPFGMGYSFVYPPTGLLFAAPLSLLPPVGSATVWAVLSICCFLFSLALVLRTFWKSSELNWMSVIALCVVWLFFNPWIETLRIGQVNAFSLAAIALFLWMYNRQLPAWLTTLPLACAVSIKLTPILLLIPLLRKKSWRHTVWLGAWGIALVTLTVLLFGISSWREYLTIFPRLSRGSLGPMSQTLEAVTFRLLPEISSVFRWTPLLCLAVLVAASRPTVGYFDAYESSLIVMGASLSSSLLWYHHIVFYLLPITALLLTTDHNDWQYWLVLLSVELIQVDRIVELTQLNWAFGLPAVLGYVLLFIVLVAVHIKWPFSPEGGSSARSQRAVG